MCYIYVYLDTRKKGSYSYGEYHFEYEPFYVGKGIGDRYLTHIRIANGSRRGINNLIIAKIRSILNDGFEPTIIKIIEGLTKENYDSYEISTIKLIGKFCDGLGPLLNTTDGGDGGITWVGEHHNKGKKLEEIVGVEKAVELKQKLSENASKRVGYLNPNFGNTGELNPIFGSKRSEETINKIREKTLEQFSNYSEDEINFMVNRMNVARNDKPEEVKQEWYKNISNSMKEKNENGELFSDEHRQKLKDANYKKLNKGSDKLKLSDETKKKLSESLKNRAFTLEHRDKLRKCISFEEFEVIIVDLVNNGVIKTITAYRKYAKDNPELKYPIVPEKSYKNCGWSGWRKYGL
jgi:hypothetical protein